MRKTIILIVFTLIAVLLTGCAKEALPSEGDVKTEIKVVTVEKGMIPQVIEENVTYVYKDDSWQETDSNITSWKWADDFIIQDTVWIIETGDAAALYSDIGLSFKGRPAVAYLHFKCDQRETGASIGETEDKTPKMDITISISCDIIFECNGDKFYLEGVKVLGGECFMDGTCNMMVDTGDGHIGTIYVPADVKKGQWSDFRNAMPSSEDALMMESSTFIKRTAFDDLISLSVTSKDVKDGVWDDMITNTNYGENLSPELTWDPVEGATNYVVVMIDGAWLHMDVFTSETHLDAGAIKRGSRGDQYVGPYPPSDTHTYSVFVFALKDESGKVKLSFDAGGNSIDQIYTSLNVDKNGNSGNVIAVGRLDGNYTHKD